ncbi:glycosyltransferase family 39 protein [Neisseriaceae bacterium ESL0693]|nr:glycosyltransferase family 39 protein [Neisseriaceae bacterium ESL0693]
MLTYTPPVTRASASDYTRPWLLLLLVFVWLWPGVFHRDLWTPGEPYLFSTIEQWHLNSWALPSLFGEPNWSASPLYVWLGAAAQYAFSPHIMDQYEATRLVSVLFMLLGFLCIGGAGRQFFGRKQGRTAVLILLGCPGLLVPGHFINSVSVLFAGAAMCCYGFSLANRRVMMASLMLGGGWVILSLSGSLFWSWLLMLLSLVMACVPVWRSRRFYLVLLISWLWAWPLMLMWPLALHQTNAAAFNQWWQYYALYPFGGLRSIHFDFSLGYYLKNLIWFAFPAWPLAIWTLTNRHHRHSAWGILSLWWLAFTLIALGAAVEQLQNLLVMCLPPLAILSMAQLDRLRRGASAFLNWFGIMAFGFLALFLWLGFAAMNYGWPARLAERAMYFSPYYHYNVNYFPLIVACVLTPLWLRAITRQHIRGRQAVTNWAAGVILVWSLLLTLFLPWLDAAKSARPVVEQMQAALTPAQQQALREGKDCIGVNARETSIRIAWQQYSWLTLQPDQPQCHYQLMERHPAEAAAAGWEEIWSGARPREKHNIIGLWVRTTPSRESR